MAFVVYIYLLLVFHVSNYAVLFYNKIGMPIPILFNGHYRSIGDKVLLTSVLALSLYYLVRLCMAGNGLKKYGQYRKYVKLREMQRMDDGLFEQMITDLFRARGFRAERIGGNGADGGVDVLLSGHGFVQCKRYSAGNNISVKIVREMIGVAQLRGYKNIYIYTTAEFTRPAIKEAELFNKNNKKNKIVLCDGVEIIAQMRRTFHLR